MTEDTAISARRHRNRLRIVAWSAAAILLLLPLIAMQFTDQVVWEATDFAIFGAMLVSGGLVFELAARKTVNNAYRSAVGVALAAAIFLLFVTGAVGLIGTENDDANLMFVGILAVGVLGVMIARFRPQGMARAMFATSLAQVLVAVIALSAGFGSTGPIWPLDILASTGFFTGLWLISAWLFRKSAGDPS
jgi:hypothetical protein